MSERMTPDSTRREEIPARPVRLADGADWGFSRPTVRLFPEVVTGIDLIAEHRPDLLPALSDADFLTRDARMVERKKYGHKKARKTFQFSKR